MFAPITFNFSNKKALIVGASQVGIRRAEKLVEYGCDVTILSKDFPDNSNLELFKTKQKIFDSRDIESFDIVVAATDNLELNNFIVNLGNSSGVLTNSVNYNENESFQFPATLQKEDLFISVSSSGKIPFLAKSIKANIEEQLSQDFNSYLRLLEESRKLLYEDKSLTKDERLQEFKRLQSLSLKELRDYNDSILNKNGEVIRIGTRGSKLALTQTEEIIKKLQAYYPNFTFHPVIIKTTGDQKQKRTIQNLGGKGAFIKEFNKALINGEIDFAVHSAKDIDHNQLGKTKILDFFPKRENVEDVLLTKLPIVNYDDFDLIDSIGTGSIRRKTFIENINKKIKIVNIRGNIDTRINKLLNDEYGGIILARAGLNRIGLTDKKLKDLGIFSTNLNITPAPLQGLLAFQTKENNSDIEKMLSNISDKKATTEGVLETKIQETFNIDCSIPFGANVVDEKTQVKVNITTFSNGKPNKFSKTYLNDKDFLNELEFIKQKLGGDLE